MNGARQYGFHWASVKGTEQNENRDAGGLYASDAYTFAIIMDASGKGNDASLFNAIWLDALLKQLPEHPPSADRVIGMMQEARQPLRQAKLFQERACFAALLIPHDDHPCTAFVCGDCRVGSQEKGQQEQWQTPVHTLEAALAQAGRSPDRHLVTRVLKACRLATPEVMELSQTGRQAWVLSTDGYWDLRRTREKRPADDCSYLRLSPGGPSQQHGDNFRRAGLYAQWSSD